MQKKNSIPLLICALFSTNIFARSIHRPKDVSLPTVTASYLHSAKHYTLADSHWESYPTFCVFNKKCFKKHLLPNGSISFRHNKAERLSTQLLSKHIEKLLDEIKRKKKKYQHFTILQKKDFSRRNGCGLLILKCKSFPFVIKLFIETPKSFVSPWGKGREPIFLFYMGGGVNRHLAGFTRIQNLLHINKKIKNDPFWKHKIATPRKWFWLPKNPKWIHIYGNNIGNKKDMHTIIPGVYAIIADYIDHTYALSLSNPDHRKTALSLCNDLDMCIDPHIQNFFIDAHSKKLVIVDTEHFPTMVGFKEEKKFNNYFEWYLRLSGKCAKNLFFRTKDERKKAQLIRSDSELT